jgi:hypothetical protein
MQGERNHRGWVAAVIVAVLLTLVVIAAERKSREWAASSAPSSGLSWMVSQRGIRLENDPRIAVTQQPAAALSSKDATRSRGARWAEAHVAGRLATPPEPVAVVVLRAPTAFPEMRSLTLSSSADTDELSTALNAALRVPVRTVSMELKPAQEAAPQVDTTRLHQLAAPVQTPGQLPLPQTLLRDLDQLKAASATSALVSSNHPLPGDFILHSQTNNWAETVEQIVLRLVHEQGLLHPLAPGDLETLQRLAHEAQQIAGQTPDHALAGQLMRVAYAVERRAKVWYAVGACIAGGWEQPTAFPTDQVARKQLHQVASTLDARLSQSQDRDAWRRYLLMDELLRWSGAPADNWEQGNALAVQILTRLGWERLTAQQRDYLNGEEFRTLSRQLVPWATQPIDYQQLLVDLEQLEQDPTNRCRATLAGVTQTLRVSPYPQQKMAADAINDHYRNANIRLSVSQQLIERMLPDESLEKRPVRQRILGADTRGNSQVRTKLQVKFVPDPHAWHMQLGVFGDMQSATQSSKGPAVFNSTSVAKINSVRTIRMDMHGMQVTADPTQVNSKQYLQSMRTDLDSLPVVGDFFRYVAREQFEQQRGVAQRVVRRMIATETDQEIDRQLGTQLKTGEQQIQNAFVAPMERLGLDPLVVSMSTTEERMMVRYRLASDMQLAAHTARPRAPHDSLLSLQVHQSAINNAIAQLGLSERSWTLPELVEQLAEVFNQGPLALPADVPRDVTIRFAPVRPITVEMLDGKIELTLRVAELEQPDRLRLERFIIRTTYVPVADGMRASLVREGVVSVDGPRLGMRERLPLRAIFGRVFAARSTLNLIHQRWESDPRAQDLAVSQIEVRDGWLGLAISTTDSPFAARVASNARQLLLD